MANKKLELEIAEGILELLARKVGHGYRPDSDLADYEENGTGDRTFSEGAVKALNAAETWAFNTVTSSGGDPYVVAMRGWEPERSLDLTQRQWTTVAQALREYRWQIGSGDSDGSNLEEAYEGEAAETEAIIRSVEILAGKGDKS